MGFAKELMLQRDGMRSAVEEVAIAAGLGERCEFHETFTSDFPDEELLVEAYKIANARITRERSACPR